MSEHDGNQSSESTEAEESKDSTEAEENTKNETKEADEEICTEDGNISKVRKGRSIIIDTLGLVKNHQYGHDGEVYKTWEEDDTDNINSNPDGDSNTAEYNGESSEVSFTIIKPTPVEVEVYDSPSLVGAIEFNPHSDESDSME